ncbi:MAG: translation initiation factor eIF-1A [archaeon]
MYYQKQHNAPEEGQDFRVRLPREGEMFAVVESLHGGKRMEVKCADGKLRMARIPGKLKKIFVREDDLVLVKPWDIEGEKKCDIAWRYKQNEIDWLKRNKKLPEFQ